MRSIAFEVPLDTAMCSAQQVHPWTMMSLGMSGWARWVRAHLVPFRALVRDHGTGVVIVGIDLEYLAPLTFFDADAFEVTVAGRVRADGSLFWFDLDYRAPTGSFARARVIGRVVRISGGDSLAARPGPLPAELLERFGPEDRFTGAVPRTLRTRDVEWSGSTSSSLRVHRGHCEAADQWSFTELPRIVADAREAWVLSVAGEAMQGVALPVRRLVAELRHPLFIFDAATVSTRADPSWRRYLHEIQGPAQTHATVLEELGEPTGVA